MLTEEQRTKIYNVMAQVYVDLIKDNKIGKVEQKVFAYKVLEHVGKAQTYDDILHFIDDMVKIYPAMQIARAKLHDDVNKIHESQVLNHLQTFLKSSIQPN